MRRHRVQNKYTINFGKKIEEAMPRAGLSYKGKGLSSYNLSVIADAMPLPGLRLPAPSLPTSISTTYDENMNKNSKKPYRSRFRSAIIFYACYKNLK